MAPYLGKNAVITFGGATLNTKYRTADDTDEADLVDMSAGADALKTYATALRDKKMNLNVLIDGTAVKAACVPGTEGTLIVGPEGSASGKPKLTMICVVASANRSYAYNDLATLAVSFAPTSTTFTEGTW